MGKILSIIGRGLVSRVKKTIPGLSSYAMKDTYNNNNNNDVL